MGNALSSPEVRGITSCVNVTSEFRKRRRRDWKKKLKCKLNDLFGEEGDLGSAGRVNNCAHCFGNVFGNSQDHHACFVAFAHGDYWTSIC
jgi:hypothetical protein